MQSRIQMGDYTSEIIEALLGLAQGGPNSGKLFAAFLSDLPIELAKKKSETIDIFGVLITCLIFMDDVLIPLSTDDDVIAALAARE